ncbi:MAG: AAA family ATPase [Acidimicrobiales bacterium]|nr:AAA family ATPase [Acidimicrobiales bacterium]
MPPQTPATPEAKQLETALFEVKRVIVGQDRAIERLFVCLLAQGHCLLEGVPGLAKTLAMETLARVSGGTFTRIQFTPDRLPADIVGTRIYRASSERFDVELGPIFANFVLADEVNRAPAKVQSALLEVMAERHVSIGGRTFGVPEPFLVLATQNPVEQEGVYPLPEAQRDRFLMKVTVGYPSPAEEVEIVNRMGVSPPVPRQMLDPEDVLALQQASRSVYVDRGVVDYAVSLVLATRAPRDFGLPELEEYLDYGASPRASLGLVAAARALALLRGRRYALPQDVFDVAPEILRHRLVLSYEAVAQGLHVDQISARILSTVPAPRVAPSQDSQYGSAGPYHQPAAVQPDPQWRPEPWQPEPQAPVEQPWQSDPWQPQVSWQHADGRHTADSGRQHAPNQPVSSALSADAPAPTWDHPDHAEAALERSRATVLPAPPAPPVDTGAPSIGAPSTGPLPPPAPTPAAAILPRPGPVNPLPPLGADRTEEADRPTVPPLVPPPTPSDTPGAGEDGQPGAAAGGR